MDFQYPCRNMLRLLFLLLKFQLGWNLTAVAHILSSIVLISELSGPLSSMASLSAELLPPSLFTSLQIPNSLCALTGDVESLALVPCLRSLLSECRKHQTLVYPDASFLCPVLKSLWKLWTGNSYVDQYLLRFII